MDMMMGLEKAIEFLGREREFFTANRAEVVLPAICMALEEFCKANGSDMVETCRMILKSAEDVNTALGKY